MGGRMLVDVNGGLEAASGLIEAKEVFVCVN